MASRILLCMFCFLLLFKVEYAFSQTQSPSGYGAFVKKQQSFAAYARDFIDFAKSGEYVPSSDLATAAMESRDYAIAASTLLEVYDSLSCPADRTAVRTLIARDVLYYSKQIKELISQVNLGISYTKSPGVAAEAIRLRDEMRELQDLFDSTKLP